MPHPIQQDVLVLESALAQMALLQQQVGDLPPTGFEVIANSTSFSSGLLRDAVESLNNAETLSLLRGFFDSVFTSLHGIDTILHLQSFRNLSQHGKGYPINLKAQLEFVNEVIQAAHIALTNDNSDIAAVNQAHPKADISIVLQSMLAHLLAPVRDVLELIRQKHVTVEAAKRLSYIQVIVQCASDIVERALLCLQSSTSAVNTATCHAFIATLFEARGIFRSLEDDTGRMLPGDQMPAVDVLSSLRVGDMISQMQSTQFSASGLRSMAHDRQRWIIALQFLDATVSKSICYRFDNEGKIAGTPLWRELYPIDLDVYSVGHFAMTQVQRLFFERITTVTVEALWNRSMTGQVIDELLLQIEIFQSGCEQRMDLEFFRRMDSMTRLVLLQVEFNEDDLFHNGLQPLPSLWGLIQDVMDSISTSQQGRRTLTTSESTPQQSSPLLCSVAMECAVQGMHLLNKASCRWPSVFTISEDDLELMVYFALELRGRHTHETYIGGIERPAISSLIVELAEQVLDRLSEGGCTRAKDRTYAVGLESAFAELKTDLYLLLDALRGDIIAMVVNEAAWKVLSELYLLLLRCPGIATITAVPCTSANFVAPPTPELLCSTWSFLHELATFVMIDSLLIRWLSEATQLLSWPQLQTISGCSSADPFVTSASSGNTQAAGDIFDQDEDGDLQGVGFSTSKSIEKVIRAAADILGIVKLLTNGISHRYTARCHLKREYLIFYMAS
ncbi:hypothetical protein EDD21DRAFT_400495 [Dissophora ornata]|nr:hypothetical protein EDD21DRAFT_400495 [Dissophora ornata]